MGDALPSYTLADIFEYCPYKLTLRLVCARWHRLLPMLQQIKYNEVIAIIYDENAPMQHRIDSSVVLMHNRVDLAYSVAFYLLRNETPMSDFLRSFFIMQFWTQLQGNKKEYYQHTISQHNYTQHHA